MISGHDIICFSNDWNQDPLSKHHIMQRLSSRNRILWINSIGLRTPTLTVSDGKRMILKIKSFFKGAKKINDNLIVISPIAVPFQGSLFIFINEIILKLQLWYYLNKFSIQKPLFWAFLPNTARFVHAFNEKLSIYYITDDFTKFEGHPSVALEKIENELIDSCDCIIASAKELAQKKSRNGKHIHIVNHGVNFEHFHTALSMTQEQIPGDIRNIPKPILGFYGELNSWLDLLMLAETALKRPRWSFVLIGRIAVEVGKINYIEKLSNVYMLGQKKYEELPCYCAAFDAALIPMKINDLTVCVNPLKLREYLAAGIPVISAPLPEVKPYTDVVKFAQTADELIAAFEEISTDRKWKDKQALSDRVKNENWNGRVEEISKIIEIEMKIKK